MRIIENAKRLQKHLGFVLQSLDKTGDPKKALRTVLEMGLLMEKM